MEKNSSKNDIVITGLRKIYNNKIIFKNTNYIINEHEFLLITGESGVGKTTLLNMIAGLEKPDSGSILMGGKPIKPCETGYVFQGFYLDNSLDISKNIELPGIFCGAKKNERLKRLDILSRIFGITDILDNKPNEISGGQAERVCIARAIFNNPKIILADEPTNNLDRANAERVLKLLKILWEKTELTVVISSHDDLAKSYATKIAIIKGGEIL
ncbi:ATP-binding cassette domain-containing protein [Candidatus Saccharibacteria bacterium]|nr:ATP-binding cassette domain-containing protein [Candidatus Saccharibacteria bacterium]